MAAKGKSSSERATRWEVLLTNLKPELAEMPHIADDFKTLEAQLAQARALETQREDFKSQARVASDQLGKILSAGDKVRARMGSTLKGKLGFTDATLVKYGFKPLAARRRKGSSQQTQGQGQTQTAPPAPGTSPASPATPPAPGVK